MSVCLPHGAATNYTHFLESAYASAWLVLLSRGADLAVIREGSTLRGPHSAPGGRLHEVHPQALRSFAAAALRVSSSMSSCR